MSALTETQIKFLKIQRREGLFSAERNHMRFNGLDEAEGRGHLETGLLSRGSG